MSNVPAQPPAALHVAWSLREALQRSLDRSTLSVLASGLIVIGLLSTLERLGGAGAANRSLTGIAMGVGLPLAAWHLVSMSHAGDLNGMLKRAARAGLDRRLALMGHAAACMLLVAVAGAAIALASVLASRGLSDPELARDVLQSSWIGALGGAAYAAYFILAEGLHRRAAAAFLLLDWLFGAGSSVLAFAWPRGHLRNLLGGTAVLDLPQWAAVLAITVLSFVALTLALARIPR